MLCRNQSSSVTVQLMPAGVQPGQQLAVYRVGVRAEFSRMSAVRSVGSLRLSPVSATVRWWRRSSPWYVSWQHADALSHDVGGLPGAGEHGELGDSDHEYRQAATVRPTTSSTSSTVSDYPGPDHGTRPAPGRPVAVVMDHVLAEHRGQVALTEDQDPVEHASVPEAAAPRR